MPLIHNRLRRIAPACFALAFISGCVHDAYYVSHKDRRYDVVPAFQPMHITTDSWVDPNDHTSQLYTSSTVTVREQYLTPFRGRLHLRLSDDPNAPTTPLYIRKEKGSYAAEAPILQPMDVGKNKVTTHFSIGKNKDTKYMAGIMFRMSF